MSDKAETIVWAECAQCAGTRHCEITAYFAEKGGDDYYDWKEEWRILRCCGCDYTFVQKVSTNSEDCALNEDGEAEPVAKTAYWPALAKRRRPEWMSVHGIDAPDVKKLNDIIVELYKALENDLAVLAAIGIRTAFDVASEVLDIDPGLSFLKKLDELVDRGHIGKPDRTRLEVLVEAGNASAHRGWKPSPPELNVMTEVLEHFVYDAFVAPYRKAKLDAKAARIKREVPARPPRTKKPKTPEES